MIKHLPDFVIALIITFLIAAWVFELLTNVLIVIAVLLVMFLAFMVLYSWMSLGRRDRINRDRW